jgi:hypothetical protein
MGPKSQISHAYWGVDRYQTDAQAEEVRSYRSSGCKDPWREQILASSRLLAESKFSPHRGRLISMDRLEAVV